jgi:hypothetical protein
MTQRMFTADQLHTYACLIEELIDPQGKITPPWNEWRNRNGINALREAAIELIDPCDADWERAYKLYKDNPEGEDPGSFDYDFVPFWLSHKVDWYDPQVAPRVRETNVSNAPPAAEPVRLPDAKLACPACGDKTHLYDRADVRYDPETGDWVVGDREGSIECTECDWSGQESDLAQV